MDHIATGFAWFVGFMGIGLPASFLLLMYFKHAENMAKITKREKEDAVNNEITLNKLMSILSIKDWGGKWEYKREECRAELIRQVQAMLDAVGEQ